MCSHRQVSDFDSGSGNFSSSFCLSDSGSFSDVTFGFVQCPSCKLLSF